MKLGLVTLFICLTALSIAQAQTEDTTDRSQTNDEANARSVESERERLGMQRIQTETEIRAREEQRQLAEAERERLGMQRIQAETELRAREEQQRLEVAERERQQAQQEAMSSQPVNATGASSEPTDAGKRKDMSRTLEQLRSLGQLKDDGYLTEEEFQRIKQRILDSQI